MYKDKTFAAGVLSFALWMSVSNATFGQSTPIQPTQGTASESAASFQAPSDQELELFKTDLRSKRKQILAANINLTDAEAEKFWPIYNQYSAELAKADDTKLALIQEYQRNYATLTDEQAAKYIKGRAAVDISVVQLRVKYFPLFQKVIPAKKTALFFQMDRRLWLMLDLQIASQNPLISP